MRDGCARAPFPLYYSFFLVFFSPLAALLPPGL